MFKSLLVMASILVGFLPSSYLKTSLESKILTSIRSENKTFSTTNNLGTTVRLPDKTVDFQNYASTSDAAYFEDYDSAMKLFGKKEDIRLPMASTTKLMTAIVSVKHLKQNDVLLVPNLSIKPLSSVMGLSANTKIKFDQILAGLLIESGADSALTLSYNVAGSEEKFVSLMNEEALLWGLKDTHFTNSVGYDEKNHYSSARDLAKMAKIALLNPLISRYISLTKYTAYDESGRGYYLVNTNKLLSDPNFKGIKTGTTLEAGQCIISLYKETDKKIIGVLLKSSDRFSETEQIIKWTKANFTW